MLKTGKPLEELVKLAVQGMEEGPRVRLKRTHGLVRSVSGELVHGRRVL